MSEKQSAAPIALLDRDGTINIDHGYVVTADRVELCPGAAQAIGDLKRAGFVVVIVSNQSAVGRGWAAIEQVQDTNGYLQELLLRTDKDAVVDLVLFAADSPDDASDRRKPGIGMLRELCAHFAFDPARCWVIGDKPSDIEFGRRAGLAPGHCLLIGRSSGLADQLCFGDLLAAVQHLLGVNAVTETQQ